MTSISRVFVLHPKRLLFLGPTWRSGTRHWWARWSTRSRGCPASTQKLRRKSSRWKTSTISSPYSPGDLCSSLLFKALTFETCAWADTMRPETARCFFPHFSLRSPSDGVAWIIWFNFSYHLIPRCCYSNPRHTSQKICTRPWYHKTSVAPEWSKSQFKLTLAFTFFFFVLNSRNNS